MRLRFIIALLFPVIVFGQTIKEGQVTNLPQDLAARTINLTRTSVKTANYAANANELVPVNTTSGSITITLPTNPANNSRVNVKNILQTTGNVVIVNTDGNATFNRTAGITTISMPLLGQGIFCQYDSASNTWTVIADDLPLSQIDTRYLTGGDTTIYLSRSPGVVSDAAISDGSTFFGTDNTASVQTVLNIAQTRKIRIIWDVAVSSSGWKIYGNTQIDALPNKGAILRNSSNKPLFINADTVWNRDPIDSNIFITGGIWNGNNYNSAAGTSQTKGTPQNGLTDVFAFYGVKNLTVQNFIILRQKIYAIQGVNIRNGLYQNGIVDCGANPTINSDGVHFDGYSEHCTVRNMKIKSFDDAIGLNADDLYTSPLYADGAVMGYYPAGAAGPINDITIDGLQLDGGLYGIRGLSGSSRIDNVKISNITGNTKGYGLILDNYWQKPDSIINKGPGNFGTIWVDKYNVNITATGGSGKDANILVNGNIENLSLNNVRRNYSYTNGTPTIWISGAATTIKNLSVTNYQSYDTSSFTTPHIKIDGIVNSFSANGIMVKHRGTSNASILVQNTGSIKYVQLNNVTADSINNVYSSTSTTPTSVIGTGVFHKAAAPAFVAGTGGDTLILSNFSGSNIGNNFIQSRGDAFSFQRINLDLYYADGNVYVNKTNNSETGINVSNANTGNLAGAYGSYQSDASKLVVEAFSTTWNVTPEMTGKGNVNSSGGTGLALSTSNATPITFYTGGLTSSNRRATIDANGNFIVGSNTTTPPSRFYLESNEAGGTATIIRNTAPASESYFQLRNDETISTTTGAGQLEYFGSTFGADVSLRSSMLISSRKSVVIGTDNGVASGGSGYIAFRTGASITPANERMRIFSNGNVSIGSTTDPGVKFGVTGSIKMVDGNQAAGKVMTSDANGVASWQTPTGGGSGFTNPMTTSGDMIYGGTSGAATRLPGNTTTSRNFLTSTGDGTNSAAPAYFNLFGTSNTWGAKQTMPSIQLTSGAAAGYYAVSDASGNSSWLQPPFTVSSGAVAPTVTTNSLLIPGVTALGYSAPISNQAAKLAVNGDAVVAGALTANSLGSQSGVSAATTLAIGTTSSAPNPVVGQAIFWFDGTNVKVTKNVGGTITTAVIY